MNLQRVGNVNFTGAMIIKDTPRNIENLRRGMPEDLTEIEKGANSSDASCSKFSITKVGERTLKDGTKQDIVILANGREIGEVEKYIELNKRKLAALAAGKEGGTTLKRSEKLKWNQLLDDMNNLPSLTESIDNILNKLKKRSGYRCWSASEILGAIRKDAFDTWNLAFKKVDLYLLFKEVKKVYA